MTPCDAHTRQLQSHYAAGLNMHGTEKDVRKRHAGHTQASLLAILPLHTITFLTLKGYGYYVNII